MMSKFGTIIRDITLFILFLAFSKQAFERSVVHMIEEKPSSWQKFDVHELDKGFLAALTATKQQVAHAFSIVENESDTHKKLEKISTQLNKIEKKYKKNSPATYLLGPIGTAAIVLKEQQLEDELLELIGDFGILLYTLNNSYNNNSEKYKVEVCSIESGIIKNKKLLNQIPHTYPQVTS